MAHEDHKRFLVEQKINSKTNKKSNEVKIKLKIMARTI